MEEEANYRQQADSYVNWITSITVANFVYVITDTGELSAKLSYDCVVFVLSNAQLRLLDFQWSCAALVAMFLFRTFGVLASFCRRNNTMKTFEKILESSRIVLCVVFVVAFILMLFATYIHLSTVLSHGIS